MNENQILSDQIRAELLHKLRDALRGERDLLAIRLSDIEAAAHVLNALDPARSGVGSYIGAGAYAATLKTDSQ